MKSKTMLAVAIATAFALPLAHAVDHPINTDASGKPAVEAPAGSGASTMHDGMSSKHDAMATDREARRLKREQAKAKREAARAQRRSTKDGIAGDSVTGAQSGAAGADGTGITAPPLTSP